MDRTLHEILREDGVAAPLRLFDADECRRLLAALTDDTTGPANWFKGYAATSPACYDVASDPRIISLLTPILGDNVILWGASLLTERPGEFHLPHCDVESADPRGGFLSLWIGLDGSTSASGASFVGGSHRFGVTAQQAAARRGMVSAQWSDEALLAAARAIDPSAQPLEFEFQDGDAALFDDRIWHGSHNLASDRRRALLLHYAAADRAVHLPAGDDSPFPMRDGRPPVLVVAGMGSTARNRLVPPPARSGDAVPNAVYQLAMPAAPAPDFATRPHFHGTTPMLDKIQCHTSMLSPGASPHPPQGHADEELMIIVSGEAELITTPPGAPDKITRKTVRAGDFGYYPAFQPHTLTNNSAAPVLYTMLQWTNPVRRWPGSDRLAILDGCASLVPDGSADHQMTVLRDRPSRWLRRLQFHTSVLPSGTGYDAHADDYDVAIILIGGTVETLGRTVTAPAVLFHPAGALHGMHSTGAEPARYLVIEFEGNRRRLRAARLVRKIYRKGRALARSVVHALRRGGAARLSVSPALR